MRGGAQLGCTFAVAFALAGCASIRGYPTDPFNSSRDAAALRSRYDEAALAAYAALSDDKLRRAKRDEIVYGRLDAYEASFSEFERDLTSENNLLNVGGSAGTVGLTTAAAIAHHATTKTNLGAYALGLTALKSDAAKDLFYQKTLPAVIAQMEANRLKIRVRIERGLSKADAEYPLEAALLDLQSLRDAGSVNAAISAISSSADTQKNQASEDLATIRTGTFAVDDNSKLLIAWYYPSGDEQQTPTDDRKKQLHDALVPLHLENYPPTMIFKSQQFAASRATLVAVLALK